MTSEEIITIIAAVSLAIVQVITAWRTSAKVETLKQGTERSDARAEKKLDQIHELTNSNLTSVKADLALAGDRIAKLEALLARAVGEASDVAKPTPVSRHPR